MLLLTAWVTEVNDRHFHEAVPLHINRLPLYRTFKLVNLPLQFAEFGILLFDERLQIINAGTGFSINYLHLDLWRTLPQLLELGSPLSFPPGAVLLKFLFLRDELAHLAVPLDLNRPHFRCRRHDVLGCTDDLSSMVRDPPLLVAKLALLLSH